MSKHEAPDGAVADPIVEAAKQHRVNELHGAHRALPGRPGPIGWPGAQADDQGLSAPIGWPGGLRGSEDEE